ncbi:MAG: hypothetical protein A2458_04210 [Candidatus Kerfeldbacteria bacterium RIFOXYC2_FULL_38_9]|nr:MAG: hypothetical protein A2458_04210 [Candidatus Kerfeldbacteria bacterium RIFOXYC2_FULL_38_9]
MINDLFYNSGPQLSPVTVMGCYFGSYNSDTSAVTFGDQKANLACESGWSNNQIIAEVPKDLSLNQTVAIAVHTAASQTTADNDVNFTVTAQCANGANVPASTGVPLLCDLYPGSGQNAADDGSIQGTKVAFYGGRFNSEKQNNFFSNSLSGEVIADDYQYNSDTKTEGRVPAGIKASGISYVKTGTEQCKSNALAFGIECGSVTDCAQGSYCVDGYCTQNACGGCTIGTAESTCGNQQGCYYNNDLGENCCTERPTIVAMSIQDGETAVCPNRKVQVEFSEPMAQYSAIKIKKINFNDTGDIVTPTEVPVTVTPDSNQAEILIIQPQAGWQVNTEYSLEIQSNPADESGLVALASGLAIKTGAKTIFFTTAGSQCKPAKIALTSKETGASDYTFYAPNTSTAFIASMLSADDQLLEPTADMGWQFVWSPYYDEERCDNAAWVELPTTTASVDAEGNVQSDASADEQIITSGSENGKNTSITVTATPLSGSNWQASDISAENQGKATISTFFCPSDQVWEYKDTNSGDNTRQNFRLIYCTGDTLPRLGIDDKPTIVAGGANDKFFRQYLFINQDNKEQAFGIRVFENKKHLSPAMWYKYNVPNPGSPQSIQLDGYEAVQDGSSYYVAASNIIGTSLYDNIYLFTFNDEKTIEQIKTQVLDNLLFNINGLDYSQCEASDKQKLVRDTKRINDMGTLQRLIDDYYDEHLKYPKPKSQAFGSYAEALTTSVWPSWQGALGNVLKQSIPEDVYNIFYATDADLATPWDAGLTPWIYTGENNNIKDCENIPAEGVYFDEAGTCWDDVNKTFYCPKESFTYLWKVDPTDIDHAQKGYLFARMEYLSTATDNYSTIDQDLMDACDGIPNAQCECYNYGSVGISGESWEVVAP